MSHSRPHTPVNLITNSFGYVVDKSIYHQLKSPLSPVPNTSSATANIQHNPITPPTLNITEHADIDSAASTIKNENIEILIHDLLTVIEDNRPIDRSQLKTVLQKCLVSLSHYKLQAGITKFTQLESLQRHEIENELIQRQVDHLILKSPFRPSSEATVNRQPRYKHTKHKISKPKLKLVEKASSHTVSSAPSISDQSTTSSKKYKNNNEFNNCIKVFHLERSS